MSLTRFLARTLIGLMLCGVASVHAADSCVVVSRGPGEVRQGTAVRRLPLSLSPCSGATVVSGDVAVCFLDANGGKVCRSVPVGTAVAEAVAGRGAQSSGSAMLSILELLRGDASTRTGRSRSIGEFEGLPHGVLLLAEPKLDLQLSDARLAAAGRLEIVVDDRARPVVVDLQVSRGAASVPADRLPRGELFEWQVAADQSRYSGKFSVAGPDADADLERVRRILGDRTLSPAARDATLIEFYNDHGYEFERDQLIAQFMAPSGRAP